MPRYTQVTPTFTPVDYATRIKPLEQYKDEYDKRLDKIEEQGLLADAIGGLIDENTDQELMDTYRDYSNRMQQTAKDLLDSGDLRSSRQSLLELRRDYANKLLPIQQAFNNRAEAAKEFRQQRAKDPSYVGNDPINTSLGSWMNGKAPASHGVSGDKVYAEAMNDAKAHMSRVRTVLQEFGLDLDSGGQFFKYAYSKGYNSDQVAEVLAQMSGKKLEDIAKDDNLKDVTEAYEYMQNAMKRLYTDNGVGMLENPNDREMVLGKALNGLLAGMSYDYKEEREKNADFMTRYLERSLGLQERAQALSEAKYGYDPKTGKITNPTGKSGSGSSTEKESKKGIVQLSPDGTVVSQHDTREQATKASAFNAPVGAERTWWGRAGHLWLDRYKDNPEPMIPKAIDSTNINEKLSPKTINNLYESFNLTGAKSDSGKAVAVANYIREHNIEIVNNDVLNDDGTWQTGYTTYAHPGTQSQAGEDDINISSSLENTIKSMLE